MAELDLQSIIKHHEENRRLAVAERRSRTDEDILVEFERIEKLHRRKCEEDVISITQEATKSAVAELVKQTREVTRQIEARSLAYNYGNINNSRQLADAPLEFQFVYGHLYEHVPNAMGIIIPAGKVTPDNGAGYLPERLKAIVLETLLHARDKKVLPIDSVSMIADHDLTIFTVDFRGRLTPLDVHEIATAYDETFLIDDLFSKALSSDTPFTQAGLVFKETQGLAIHNLHITDIASIVDRRKTTACLELPGELTGKYVSEDLAVDMLYGLSNTQPGYKRKHDIALSKFKVEMAAGTFADLFNDLHAKEVGGEMQYHKGMIVSMLNGRMEEISGSGSKQTVKCHYVVPVSDEMVMARFFPLGAYVEADAMIKYSFSKKKLDANFEEEGGLDPRKRNRIMVTRPDGVEMLLYLREDLEGLL